MTREVPDISRVHRVSRWEVLIREDYWGKYEWARAIISTIPNSIIEQMIEWSVEAVASVFSDTFELGRLGSKVITVALEAVIGLTAVRPYKIIAHPNTFPLTFPANLETSNYTIEPLPVPN